jgi:hypothetical protein
LTQCFLGSSFSLPVSLSSCSCVCLVFRENLSLLMHPFSVHSCFTCDAL